jgi:hypothetical protein
MGTSETHDASMAAPSVFHRADGRTEQVAENPPSGVAGSSSGPSRTTRLPRSPGWRSIQPSPPRSLSSARCSPRLPLFLRTLVVTAVLVPIMAYLLVPGMQRLFAGWLNPR